MAVVRLKHTVFEGDTIEGFYDGELNVVAGIIAIPDNSPAWAAQAWFRGYRIDPVSGEELTPAQVSELNEAATYVYNRDEDQPRLDRESRRESRESQR